MGKNKDKKDGTPNPASVANRDILQRLNFLYQASVFLSSLAPPSPVIPEEDGDNDKDMGAEQVNPPAQSSKSQRKRRRRRVSFGELSRSYLETMKTVGQKTNVRIDPSVKRRICKRCSAPLVPGISAAVRIKDSPSHGHLVAYRCHYCQTERRIPAPPVLHVDQAGSSNNAPVEAQSAELTTSIAPAASTNNTLASRKRKRKGPEPRLPPHFARDVGHVVFRGNERLDAAHQVP